VEAGTSASAVLVFSTVTALHPKDVGACATLAAGLLIITGPLFIAVLQRHEPAGPGGPGAAQQL